MRDIALRENKSTVRALVKDVGGWLADREGELLYDLARACSGRGCIVEIGSWKGKSTIWLARGSKAGRHAKVYAVDPHTGSREHQEGSQPVWTFEEFRANLKRADVEDLVVPLLKASAEAARAVPEPVELIFIDGAHEYDLVKLDFLTWFPKVLEGGVMAFHDTVGWEGPKRVVEELLFRSPHFRRLRIVGSITAGEKAAETAAWDRWRSRYVLGLKRAYEVARRVPLPKRLRKLVSRLLTAMQ